MKRLDRYIIQEVLTPTGVAFLILSAVMVLSQMFTLVSLVAGSGRLLSGLLVIVAATVALSKLTLPASFLVGCTTAFNRMSMDLEITAARSLGISFKRLAMPALLTGAVLSLLLLIVNMYVSPWGYRSAKAMALQILLSKKNYGIEANSFCEVAPGLTVYARKVEDRWLRDLIIFDMRNRDKTVVIEARRGIIKRTAHGALSADLYNGSIISVENSGKEETISFEKIRQRIPIGGKGILSKPTKRELPLPQLIKRLERERGDRKHHTETLMHLHKRIALALSPVIFALVSIPLSMGLHRRERWSSAGLSAAIFAGYFGLLSLSQNLIYRGLPPMIAAWMPNLLFAAAGIAMLRGIDGRHGAFR